MITSMRQCVSHNHFLPWPISSRSFSHDFAIKWLKYGTFCRVCSTACTVLDGFFPYLAQMIINMRGCVACNDLWPRSISWRSFSHDFAIKRLKYGILSCLLYSLYSSGWIFFSCDQAALWMVQSVCLSVCPSIRHTFLTMFPSSYHMKFSGVITSDRSDVHAKGLDQRSKVKVTEVTTQLNPFQTVTPVWIHIWWWNDAYSLIMLRERCPIVFQVHPSNFKVTRF